uniref:SdrD B-like domain-containing protein n=1 Tax=Primorskyibacter sedentarius TaxID=745311 RepID=UPI003EBE1D3C
DVDAGVQYILGSLSGRYFFDENQDGLDNDGADNGITGVEVQLLDAAGNPIPGRTTTTDAQGNYSFAGLVAAVYGVKFTDNVSGNVLTTQDVDGNVSDDIDSDALDVGGNMSVISGIVVVGGQDTPDNDAGVIEPNEDPTATDDAGMGCADTDITVDFSDNYADADSASVAITMINGEAISQGNTITLANGVEVTLTAGDEFIFNGETAYAALDIGEQATETFEVKVEDSDGGFATADIDVTFCGDANSYGSLAATFPASIDYQVISALRVNPIGDFGFDLKIDGTGDARFDGVIFEQAYCLSFFDPAGVAATFDLADTLGGDMYSSEAVPTSLFNANQISSANGQSAADNMDLVNWIVSQCFEDDAQYNGWEVQFAIWELTDDVDADDFAGVLTSMDVNDVDTIVNAALAAENEGFTFSDSGKVAAVIDPNPVTAENSQPFIVAMDFEQYDCIC